MAINEGQTIQYIVTTTNTADGTVLYWQTTGNTTNSDIQGGNTGSVTITNNQAIWNVTVLADSTTDGVKSLGLSLSTGSLSGPVVVSTANPITVTDSSRSPQYSLYFWGRNAPIGISGTNDAVPYRSSPTQVGSSSWSKVSVGHDHVVAVATNGTLWSWGNGIAGSLGLNENYGYRSSPTQIGALTTWLDVSTCGYHTLAIKTDGTLWGWGTNSYGQLGSNDISSKSSPVQIGSGTSWANVSCMFTDSLARRSDDTLWGMGRNYHGELAQNNVISRSSPVQVSSGSGFYSLIATGKYSAAGIYNGVLTTWGFDSGMGNLGINASGNRSQPVQVNGSWSKVDICTNDGGFVGIKTNGTIWQTGGGYYIDGGNARSSPVQIGSATDWTEVYANKWGAFAKKANNTAYAWGQNNQGQLGQNNTNYLPANSGGIYQLGSTTQWRNFASTKSSTNDQTVFGTTID